MKTLKAPVRKAGPGVTSLILLSAVVGAGSASAETFGYGSSTTTIEQRGGGTSRSEVTRYKDGQKIITRDGNSTDITIQGESDSYAGSNDWAGADQGLDRFDRQRFEERFSRGANAYPPSSVWEEREAIKQRMFDRMRGRF